MKKNKKKKMPVRLPKTQEQAEVFESEIHLCQELKKRDTVRTPDFLELKLRPFNYLFVYGTLKTGGRLTSMLDGCPFLGEAYTCVKGFNMDVAKAGAFPIIFNATSLSEKATASYVFGEVYVVDVVKIAELDVLEANGKMYNREEHWFWLEDQRLGKTMQHLRPNEKCWMYVGDRKYWQGRDTVGYPYKVRDQKRILDFDPKLAREMVSPKEPIDAHPYSNVWNNWVAAEIANAWPC